MPDGARPVPADLADVPAARSGSSLGPATGDGAMVAWSPPPGKPPDVRRAFLPVFLN